VVLKHIRIRDGRTFGKLVSGAGVALAKQTPRHRRAYACLLRLHALMTQCSQLREAKSARLFPCACLLLAVERLHGGYVSDDDMHGRVVAVDDDAGDQVLAATTAVTVGSARTKARRTVRSSRHAALYTDTNDIYVQMRASRAAASDAVDFVSENIAFVGELNKSVVAQKRKLTTPAQRAAQRKHDAEVQRIRDGDEEYYVYSGQRLNTVDVSRKALQRRALASGKYYSYSKDFASASLDLVDVDATKTHDAFRRDERTKWLTSDGFTSKDRDANRYTRHVDKPHPARCAELATPWLVRLAAND
jgi:hypothetical protein